MVLEGYGLSETSPVASFNHPDRERKAGSIGTPIEGVEMKVVDDDDDDVARPARSGEIVIRGHNVMKGYWERADATQECHARRLVPHRRHGARRRGRLLLHRRPQEGPDHPRRLQRLPARGRGGPLRAPGRGRGRRARRAPRRAGRGGRRRRVAQGRRERRRRRAAGLRQGAGRGLQVPAAASGSWTSCPRARRARSSSARSRRPPDAQMAARSDLVIVGMGSGGMVAAEFAATLGREGRRRRARPRRRRLPVDRVRAVARRCSRRRKVAHTMRHADRYGLPPCEPRDRHRRACSKRVRAVQARHRRHRRQRRRASRRWASRCASGAARLDRTATPCSVGDGVGGEELEARFILLCTGSRPAVPPIPGLRRRRLPDQRDAVRPARGARRAGRRSAAGRSPSSWRRPSPGSASPTTVLQRGPAHPAARRARAGRRCWRASCATRASTCALDVEIERVAVEDGDEGRRGTVGGEQRGGAADEILRRRRADAERRRPRPRRGRASRSRPRASRSTTRMRTTRPVDLRRGRRRRPLPVHPLRRLRGRRAPSATCSSRASGRGRPTACRGARSPIPSWPTPG